MIPGNVMTCLIRSEMCDYPRQGGNTSSSNRSQIDSENYWILLREVVITDLVLV